MLKQGGNSFDAVIATQLALAVVYPQAGNIGGGGFWWLQPLTGKSWLWITAKPHLPKHHLICIGIRTEMRIPIYLKTED
jgi:gamma-glutamyltranspeptidase